MTSLALLQLVSPALPVGAFSYSEGLEVLIQAGSIADAAEAQIYRSDTQNTEITNRVVAPDALMDGPADPAAVLGGGTQDRRDARREPVLRGG